MLIAFTLVLARVTGLFAVAPVFSRGPLPVRFKALLAIVFAGALAPAADLGSVPAEGYRVAAAMVCELGIGLAIGLFVRLFMVSFQLAGAVMAFQMGFALANSFDPETEESSPVIATIHLSLVTLVFLLIEGHHFLLRSLAASFDSFPIASVTNWELLSNAMIFSASEMYSTAAQVAAPVAGLLLLTNAMVGFLNRVSPQLSIFNIGFPMTVFGGLMAVLAALPGVVKFFLSSYLVLESRLVELLVI